MSKKQSLKYIYYFDIAEKGNSIRVRKYPKCTFFFCVSAPEAIRLKLVMGRVAPIKKSE